MAYITLSNYKSKGNASAENVLKDKTFSNDNGVNLIGTMPDNTTRTSNGNVAGVNQNTPNNPVRDGTGLQIVTNTDNQKKIVICPPQGFYQGNDTTASYVSVDAADLGSANVKDVLNTKKFTSTNGKNINGLIEKKDYTTPRNGETGYYASGGYGWAHVPSAFYDLTQDEVQPEVRINAQELFEILATNVGDLKIEGSFEQYSSYDSKTVGFSYTATNDYPISASFVLFGWAYSYLEFQQITYIAKRNNVDLNVSTWGEGTNFFFYLRVDSVTIKKNDIIQIQLTMPADTQAHSHLHIMGAFKCETNIDFI